MEGLLILVLFAGTIALISSPFLKGKEGPEGWEMKSAGDVRLRRLTQAKDSHYKAIKDVEFEFAEGKLSEKDFNELRGYYKEKALMTIKEIENLKTAASHARSSEKEKGHGKGKK